MRVDDRELHRGAHGLPVSPRPRCQRAANGWEAVQSTPVYRTILLRRRGIVGFDDLRSFHHLEHQPFSV
jgi:hypothetical protein